MKILIIGAGTQGGPCASILSRDPDVEKIVIGDIDVKIANQVKDKIASSKITVQKLNANDVQEVEQAATGMDAIINLTLTEFNDKIMKGALNAGVHYVDTSFGEPSLMDICERDNILGQIIQNQPISFDQEFKDAGLTAIVGCGASPGVVNVLARLLADKLDVVDAIRIRVGRKELDPSNDIVTAWQPFWSPFRALWGYAVEPTMFENGEYKKHPIYSGYEEYQFPDPVNTVPLVNHQHQEPISLPHFIRKGIKHCDFKYPIDRNIGTLIKTGFASSKPVEVKGCKVAPIDVLLKMVPKPVDAFLAETAETAGQPLSKVTQAAVEVSGKQGREAIDYKIVYSFTMFTTPEERLALYTKFGASNIYVCLPAIVGLKMCLSNIAPRGVIAAECLDPIRFFNIMSEMTGPINFQESCVKNVEF